MELSIVFINKMVYTRWEINDCKIFNNWLDVECLDGSKSHINLDSVISYTLHNSEKEQQGEEKCN